MGCIFALIARMFRMVIFMALSDDKIKNTFLRFSLVSLVFAGGALISVPSYAWQDSDTEKTIELVEEKAPRVSKNTTKVSLLKAESLESGEKVALDSDYISFKMPDHDALKISIGQNLQPNLDLQRSFNIPSVIDGINGASLLTRSSSADLLITSSSNTNPLTDGLSLSLSSGVEFTPINAGIDGSGIVAPASIIGSPFVDGLLERKYNVGVAVGFEGVVLDANYMEKDNALFESYKGLDLGLGYQSTNWMTRLGVKGYNFEQSTDVNLLPEGVRQLYQFELGGAYRLTSRMSLAAGFRVTDYGRLLYQEDTTWGQTFYLGGRFSY